MNSHEGATEAGFSNVLVAASAAELPQFAEHLAHIGAKLTGATSAAEVWQILDTQSFDLLLLDLDLPDLKAGDLISFLRQQPRTHHMPVIVMATADDTQGLDEAFAAGAGSVLTKPIHWTVFEHHLDVALRMIAVSRRSRGKAQQALACGRAKEALVGSLCSEALAAAGVVLDEVERIWRALPAASAPPPVHDGLRRVAREATALRNVALRAESLVDEVSQALVFVDRSEELNQIIERTLDGLEQEAADNGVRLVADLPDHETMLICDPGAIEQALRHVLHNAILYSPSDSNVSISTSIYPDGLLAIDVTDEGEGMHPDYVARCLTPLKAGGSAISPNGRLGFGLPLAKAIVEAHEGALEIRSMPGEGTTALLILPAERVVQIGKSVREEGQRPHA